jgi:hypothetical protein
MDNKEINDLDDDNKENCTKNKFISNDDDAVAVVAAV